MKMSSELNPESRLGWVGPWERYPWWPVRIKEMDHERWNELVQDGYVAPDQDRHDFCTAYHFGTCRYANYPVDAIEPWECDRHEKFLRGMPKSKLDDVEIEELFHKAIAGATSYATSHAESQGTLEVKRKSPQLDPPIAFESIVWAKVIGYPWLPAYVLNPFYYDTQAKAEETTEQELIEELREAQHHPKTHRFVYYFQSHNFSLHVQDPDKPPSIKPWMCDERSSYLYPRYRREYLQQSYPQQLATALEEVAEFQRLNPNVHDLPGMEVLKLREIPARSLIRQSSPQVKDKPTARKSVQSVTPPSLALGWHIKDNHPWMPVVIFAMDTSMALELLKRLSRPTLEVIKKEPSKYRVLYHFGKGNMCVLQSSRNDSDDD
ncbi:hypothetical protein AC1031_012839 [Aphanomyces cochlioides]|nr:hypothetical protein AC1031_012839 [Aphanomyces cochlioides]